MSGVRQVAIKEALGIELERQAEDRGYFVRKDDGRCWTIDGFFDIDAIAQAIDIAINGVP